MTIELGTVVRDCISGFSGKTVIRRDYLHGTSQYGVQNGELTEAGLPTDVQWFDEGALEELADKNPDETAGFER